MNIATTLTSQRRGATNLNVPQQPTKPPGLNPEDYLERFRLRNFQVAITPAA